MPQINTRPHSGAFTYRFKQTGPDRSRTGGEPSILWRWSIWFARFVLLGVFIGSYWILRAGLHDAEDREVLLMSALTATVLVVIFLVWAHEAINKAGKVPRTRVTKVVMTLGASCAAVGIFLAGAQADAVNVLNKVAHRPRPLLALADGADRLAIHDDHLGLLPRFSMKMTGGTQAPVSLIFLGSGAQLLEVFKAAGWHAADRVNVGTALRAFARGVLNRPYFTAPVFPSFLDGKLHDVAFQRTDDGGSSRRRHHARWWLTDFVCEGRQVWVATASYDAGVGVGRIFPTPIHHIHPDIDAERDYIVRSLTAGARVQVTQEVRITQPMAGRNAAGDPFFTQGMAFVLA